MSPSFQANNQVWRYCVADQEDTGESKVWQIVGEPEADAHKGNISVTSPIARALIGKTRRETIEVETPSGAKVYQIRKIEARDKSLN
jgi:transcription elongation GreA/GreB family factor